MQHLHNWFDTRHRTIWDRSGLELDDTGRIISYEEYYPYGSTSYQSVRSQTETPKRYRYSGTERDEESGLNYHGARYYSPWIGRWINTDPIGIQGGPNLYAYAQGNPVMLVDASGRQPEAPVNLPRDEEGNYYLGEQIIESPTLMFPQWTRMKSHAALEQQT